MAQFSAQVGQWVQNVKEAQEAIFRGAAQRLVQELDSQISAMVYSDPATADQRTGFLRASLVASKTAMPQAVRDNPGVPVPNDNSEVLLVINTVEPGDQLFLGYTAAYGGYVHYGTSRMPGRPWVDLVAQRWPMIVAEVSAEVKARFAL